MKRFVISILLLSALTSLCSCAFYAYVYFKYAKIEQNQAALREYVASMNDTTYVTSPLTNETSLVIENKTNNSVNAVFEPLVTLRPGADIGFDSKKSLHDIGDDFSIGELALLNKAKIPTSFEYVESLNTLEVPTGLTANIGVSGNQDGVFARAVSTCASNAAIASIVDLFASIILLIIAIRGIRHSLYAIDLIFIRFDFVNNSHIVLRRFLSVIINGLLIIGCLGTIIMPFAFYYSTLFSQGGIEVIPVVISYLVCLLFVFWAVSSTLWWVMNKEEKVTG